MVLYRYLQCPEQGGLLQHALVTGGGSASQVWSDASVCGVPTMPRAGSNICALGNSSNIMLYWPLLYWRGTNKKDSEQMRAIVKNMEKIELLSRRNHQTLLS